GVTVDSGPPLSRGQVSRRRGGRPSELPPECYTTFSGEYLSFRLNLLGCSGRANVSASVPHSSGLKAPRLRTSPSTPAEVVMPEDLVVDKVPDYAPNR